MTTPQDLLTIIELAFDFLPKHDQTTPLRVCKNWYRGLQQRLYREVFVHNGRKQLRCFIRTLARSAKTPTPVGHSIQELDLNVRDALSQRILARLIEWCPNVKILDVDVKEIPMATMVSWCGALRKLNELVLHLREGMDVFEILRQVPKLKSLKVLSLPHSRKHIFDYAEAIHECCPHLEVLMMDMSCAYPSSLPPVFVSDKFFRNVKPSRSMKKVWFILDDRPYHYPQLLMYMAFKYPCLQMFDLCYRNVKKFPQIKHTINPFTLFAERCPQLQEMNWQSECIPSVRLYDALAAAGTKLTKLCVSDFCFKESFPPFRCLKAYESLLCSALRHTVTNFDVTLTNTNTMTPYELISDLRWLPNLTRLSLNDGSMERVVGETYDVNHILDCCKRLVELNMKVSHPLAASETYVTKNMENHPLQRLEIKLSTLSKDVLPCFSVRCRKLVTLSILLCKLEAKDHEIRIDMPYTSMGCVNIDTVRPLLEGGIVKFLAQTEIFGLAEAPQLQQYHETLTRWYYMAHCRHPEDYLESATASKVSILDSEEVLLAQQLVDVQSTGPFNIKERFRQLYPDGGVTRPSIWKPQDLCNGYIHLVSRSVRHLYYNEKQL